MAGVFEVFLQIAARERSFVPSSIQDCWNWYDTLSGRAQAEENSINAAIEKICLLQAVDRNRIAIAGISAGAGMAVLLARHHPERFRAIALPPIAPDVFIFL